MEDIGIDGRMWVHGLDASGTGQEQVAGSCENHNEPSESM